ncbi:MAG: aldehyde dehydrogenase family protein, partial [Pleurocapsa sp. SU_196_0]|nr:aldehyde dehydrogenase family protein [Pleurocapsa sp. SU_196_0]
MTMVDLKRISHWVGGKVVTGRSGRTSKVYNPATGDHTADVDLASVEEIDAVIQTAAQAFPAWRATPLSRRAEIMFKFRELIDAKNTADGLVYQNRKKHCAIWEIRFPLP